MTQTATKPLTIDELREAAAQAQVEREQEQAREAAEKAAEKAREAARQRDAFIAAAENIFREELGVAVRIPPDQVVDWYESYHQYAWQIPDGLTLSTRQWRGAGGTPPTLGLQAYTPSGSMIIRTLADLADAFAKVEQARERDQALTEEYAKRKREQEALERRHAELKANEPAAPAPQAVIDNNTNDGLHLMPKATMLDIEVFHIVDGQPGPTVTTRLNADEVLELLAALKVGAPATVEIEFDERVVVRKVAANSELLWWGFIDDTRTVLRQRLAADTVAVLQGALDAWLAYHAAYEDWRDELDQVGADLGSTGIPF